MQQNNQTQFKETEIGLIPEDWDILKLEDICDVKGGKRLPKGENLVDYKTNHPYLRIVDFSDDGVVLDGLKYIKEETYQKIKNYIIEKDNIYISNVGTVGLIGIIDDKLDKANLTENAVRLLNYKNVNNKFILQYLKSDIGQSQIKENTVGAVQPKLPIYGIKNIKIPIPSLQEQQKIAEILSSLDDKIELLKQQNKTLENIGQAIFKRWFVDFEFPDEDGKPYKSSGGKMVDGELGEMPEGWKVFYIKDFMNTTTGKKDANIQVNNGLYPFFTCSQSILNTNEYSFDCSALLLAGNGDFNIKWYEGKFEAYQRTYVLIPEDKVYLGFFYYLIKYFLNDITAGYRGSVIRFLTKNMIEDFKFCLDKGIDIAIFYKLNNNIDFNNKEIQTLSQFRDSILPKLMSGKIRVK